mgnify:CR=1 FL=1
MNSTQTSIHFASDISISQTNKDLGQHSKSKEAIRSGKIGLLEYLCVQEAYLEKANQLVQTYS